MFKKLFSKIRGKKNPKVLIVEDDSLLARVIEEELAAEKINVVIVSNGLDVMSTVDKFRPDLILLDLILPGLDGFAILKQLKDDRKTADIPVLVLSNLDEAGDVKSVKALGAQDYFIKANTEMSKIVDYVKKQFKM